MSAETNRTHDPTLRSWVDSANDPATDFPIQNLPFGVFKPQGADEDPRVGVAIGDRIVDIPACRAEGLFKGPTFAPALSCEVASLNPLMALGQDAWNKLRHRLSELLRADHPDAERYRRAVEKSLAPMASCEMLLPVDIGDFTAFQTDNNHRAAAAQSPSRDLARHHKYMPAACHGRASSVVISGTPVRRPSGQFTTGRSEVPIFGPTRFLDYGLEVGFFVGPGNAHGTPVPIGTAERHIFGLCLVNDWSAHDIRLWEDQPAESFLAGSFATSVSPWVVTLEALAPWRTTAFERPAGDPDPLAHLDSREDRELGGIDVVLEASILSDKMREQSLAPAKIGDGRFRDMYWTIAQMLAHHTSNGCNIRPGDLMAGGTVPGGMGGSLYDITVSQPIELPTGEERRVLHDGDEIIIAGYCEREGSARIGFGKCRGVITSAF